MADIIDIGLWRKLEKQKPTLEDLAFWCHEDILSSWEKFARQNRLIDFFRQSIPQAYVDDSNPLQDLNAIASLEAKLNIQPQVVAPGFDPAQLGGWAAAFRINGKVIATPWLTTECLARAFNILLYLKLKREARDAGIVTD